MATMKMTLLEMVQSILDSVNADEVSSITDTEEAQMVAGFIRDTYYSLVNTRWFPEHYEMVKLVALSNTLYPTTLRIPDNVSRVEWFKYNVSLDGGTTYRDIDWLEPRDFADRMFQLNAASPDVETKTNIVNGTPLLVWNNRMPTCFTSFDDNYIICDAYKNTIDNTLQESKTLAYVRTTPTFTIDDSFVPDIDPEVFPYLLAESKSLAHSLLLKTLDQKVEQMARRQKNFIQNDKMRIGSKNGRPNYGRS